MSTSIEFSKLDTAFVNDRPVATIVACDPFDAYPEGLKLNKDPDRRQGTIFA